MKPNDNRYIHRFLVTTAKLKMFKKSKTGPYDIYKVMRYWKRNETSNK